MDYRVNRRTGDRISVIGPGSSYIAESDEKTATETLIYAYEHGINYADLTTDGARTFFYYGTALRSVREKMYDQVHFGANYETGENGWTTDLETVKRQIDCQMARMNEIGSFFNCEGWR